MPYVGGIQVSEYDRKHLNWNLQDMRERLSLEWEETSFKSTSSSKAVDEISKRFEAHLKYGADHW